MYIFALHLKAHDHTNFNFNNPWYGLQTNFKRPHISWSQSQYTTQTTSKFHNVYKRNSGHLWHTRMSSGLTPTACVRTNTSEAPKSGSTASSRTSSTWSHTQKHAQKLQNVRSNSYNRSKMHLCRNRIFPNTMSLTKKVLIHRINTRKIFTKST